MNVRQRQGIFICAREALISILLAVSPNKLPRSTPNDVTAGRYKDFLKSHR